MPVSARAKAVYGGKGYQPILHPVAAIQSPTVRLKYKTGTILKEPLHPASIQIIRQTADILDQDGEVLMQQKIVVCKRHNIFEKLGYSASGEFAKFIEKMLHIGTPVSVIDPGTEHHSFVLLNGHPNFPLILKGFCCSAEKGDYCPNADANCGTCCNNYSGKKKQK
jgi:hypothetical protein